MKAIVSKIGARDVFLFLGLSLTASGAAMVYRPAGLLTLGAFLLYLGLYGIPSWR